MKKSRMVEDYLDGSLSGEGKKKFEEQLGRDKELADILKMHTEMRESIRDHELHALHKMLKEVGEAFNLRSGGGGRKQSKRAKKSENKKN